MNRSKKYFKKSFLVIFKNNKTKTDQIFKRLHKLKFSYKSHINKITISKTLFYNKHTIIPKIFQKYSINTKKPSKFQKTKIFNYLNTKSHHLHVCVIQILDRIKNFSLILILPYLYQDLSSKN